MDKHITRLNIDTLPDARKNQLFKFLVGAVLSKRIFCKKEFDKKLGKLFEKIYAIREGKNTMTITREALLLAQTAEQALLTQKRRYFYVTDVTKNGVYGVGVDTLR